MKKQKNNASAENAVGVQYEWSFAGIAVTNALIKRQSVVFKNSKKNIEI